MLPKCIMLFLQLADLLNRLMILVLDGLAICVQLELAEPKIDQKTSFGISIVQEIAWFDISVHDALVGQFCEDVVGFAQADAHPGRNVLEKGADVKKGHVLVKAGIKLTPQSVGLLIAGGVLEVKVYRKPKIGLLATGSEVIMPGQTMLPGKVFASNVFFQKSWLVMLGFDVRVLSAIDSVDQIAEALIDLSEKCDVVITSGGAWKGDRDLIAKVIRSLGGELVFHRLRLGPGKATGMGFINTAKVFCLSGGPAANMFGFVMLALPALYKMSGIKCLPFQSFKGILAKEISGKKDWTNLVQCQIIKNGPDILLSPMRMKSRLISMATNHAIVVIPEGVEKFKAGDAVPFICLDMDLFAFRI